jgi:hypothetical protein
MFEHAKSREAIRGFLLCSAKINGGAFSFLGSVAPSHRKILMPKNGLLVAKA